MATSSIKQFASNILSKLAHKGEPAHAEDASEENDLSYETALLNLEIRSFLHSEYAGQEPPSDAFQQLLRTIETHERTENKRLPYPARVRQYLALSYASFQRRAGSLYRTATRPGVTGALSSGLVAMFVVMTMWPHIASTLNTGRPSYSENTLPPRQVKYLSDNTTPLSGQESASEPAQTTVKSPSTGGTVSPGSSTSSSEASPQAISPGLVYEQRRMWLQEHMGEYLDTPTQLQTSPEQQSERALSRQSAKSQSEGDGAVLCAPNQLCPK